MAKQRRLDTMQKVRKMVRMLDGSEAVVKVMGCASVSSLRRWMKRECEPIQAHVQKVNEAYPMALRMEKAFYCKLTRESEREFRKKFKRK